MRLNNTFVSIGITKSRVESKIGEKLEIGNHNWNSCLPQRLAKGKRGGKEILFFSFFFNVLRAILPDILDDRIKTDDSFRVRNWETEHPSFSIRPFKLGPPPLSISEARSRTWQRIRPSFRPESKTIKNEFNFGFSPPLPPCLIPNESGIFIGTRYSRIDYRLNRFRRKSSLQDLEIVN